MANLQGGNLNQELDGVLHQGRKCSTNASEGREGGTNQFLPLLGGQHSQQGPHAVERKPGY